MLFVDFYKQIKGVQRGRGGRRAQRVLREMPGRRKPVHLRLVPQIVASQVPQPARAGTAGRRLELPLLHSSFLF